MSFKLNKKRVKSEPLLEDLSLDTEEKINLKTDSDEGFSFDTVGWATDEGISSPKVEKEVVVETRKKSIKTPTKQLENIPEIDTNVDVNNLNGKIEGSDFTENGALKKQKKKRSKGAISGAISAILLVLVLGVAFKVIIANKETIVEPEDTTNVTLNELVPQDVDNPHESEGLGVLGVTGEEIGTNNGGGNETVDDETVIEKQPLEGYLGYTNSYVDFGLNYPETWFITETTQEGFNQLKTLVSEGTIFSLNSAELLEKLPLLTLNSPSSELKETVIIESHNSKFDIEGINAPLEFTKTEDAKKNIRLAQPTTKTTHTTENGVYDVRYNIYKEIDIYTSVIQFSKSVGNNLVVVLYTAPFDNEKSLGTYEQDPFTGDILNAEDTKPHTLEALLESNGEVVQSILNTLYFN